jgi:DNA-binding beta-propeller fold protein YncE
VRLKLILPLALLVGCHEGKTPPPWGVPVTGGTMAVSRSGSHAIVSDPDRDRVVIIDLASKEITAEIKLDAGDQPGRVIEDGAGQFHTALRGGAALVTFNLSGVVLNRRITCLEPRGLAWDAATDNIHVACATGELVSFHANDADYFRIVRLERDLRDVIVQGDKLVISKFKSAELLTVDANGAITGRVVPPNVQRFGGFGGGFPTDGQDGGVATPPGEPGGLVDAVPAVAWRTIALPDGRIVMSHQRAVRDKLGTQEEGGYGTGCGGAPVEAAITVVTPGQAPIAAMPIAQGALPIDIAITKQGDKIAVLTAGNRNVRIQQTSFALSSRDMNDCRPPDFPDDPKSPTDDDDDDDDGDDVGTPTALAFAPNGDLVIYYPEAPMIEIRRGGVQTAQPEQIMLPGMPGHDAGRAVFHQQTQIGLACASCHPEGREDGLTWDFVDFGKRRTQNLSGDILQRAPYHWNGDMSSLPTLMDDVFAVRMAGGALSERQKRSLGPWLDRIPAPAPAYVASVDALERGKQIFESPATGCVSCHSGALLTDNKLVDVGTGAKFKVPSLRGIGARAPYMHDGCAKTLTDRFTVCGNSTSHGLTGQLAPGEISDLVAYLESL